MAEKIKKFRSKRKAEITTNVIVYIILVCISVVWLLPYFYLVFQSFRGESTGVVGYMLPKEWTFNNYIELFTDTETLNFPMWYLNTLIVALVTCIIQTFIVLATSYCLSRMRFKGRKGLMNLMLILGMFPGFMTMTAIYFILKQIGLTGNLAGLILVYVASSAMGYYISKGFFDTIPRSLDEAAKIDGASQHTIFIKVILPLAKPIVVYTILTSFLAPWGDYMFASLMMLGETDKFNVAVGLKEMLTRENLPKYFTRFCAGAVVVSIPIAALFIWLQRFYVEGVTGGAVKG